MEKILNKKARQKYQVLDRLEAGLVLEADQVKILRSGQISLTGVFGRVIKDGNNTQAIYLVGINWPEYLKLTDQSIKLLLHRKEIERLIFAAQAKSQTIIPLKIYNKKGKFKVEIGLVQGKKQYDHREELKKRDQNRQIERNLKYV